MGIINGFDDIKFTITDLTADTVRNLVAGREFAVIKVPPEVYNNPLKYHYCYFDLNAIILGMCLEAYTLEIKGNDNSGDRTFLWIKVNLNIKPRKVKGVKITYPSVGELIDMLSGKKLVFSVHFVRENSVEESVNDKIQEYVFNVRSDKEYYLEDRLFDVKVFLQKISRTGQLDYDYSEPIDIRNLDVNGKMLSILNKASNSFYGDAWTVNYASESPELKAQYFLSKFHSNRKWDADPVCILNCRMSAYVLPCVKTKKTMKDFPEDRIVFDTENENLYVIDSIHVNTDICFNLKEFEEIFGWFTSSIALA